MSTIDRPVLFVLGPTAVGKSALALHLARAFDGEIVSADSRQVYRLMDVGTAKPSLHERASVPHHLIDILDPDQEFSLANFLELARQAVRDIHSRGKLPIAVGGTGQYLCALFEGWRVPAVPHDPRLRRELEEEAKRKGNEALHRQLSEVDPEAASRIDTRNVRRVIRALEIYRTTGTPPTNLRRKAQPPYHSFIIGLTTSREELYRRIDRRVEQMLKQGLEAEVRNLVNMECSAESPPMSSMGYKQMALFLAGGCTLREASQRIKFETHRFARQQYAWFRLADPRIHWLETGPKVTAQAAALVEGFLREGYACGKIASDTGERAQ